MNELDKKIDGLVKKAIQNNELDVPSLNFTDNIMQTIEATENNKSVVYKPLISKTVWFAIFIGFAGLIIYSFYTPNISSDNIVGFDKILSYLPSINLPKITLSKIAFNSILLISVIIVIQFSMLKNYFNKRIDI